LVKPFWAKKPDLTGPSNTNEDEQDDSSEDEVADEDEITKCIAVLGIWAVFKSERFISK
jgi:hypothetical protein